MTPPGQLKKTLKKACEELQKMEGRKILFVANEKVEVFAKKLVQQSRMNVEVKSLGMHRVDEDARGKLHQNI